MVKKGEKIVKPKSKSPSNREVQLALVENFVSLQKVLTNLTVKFDELSGNMSRLLQLFEVSARTFIEKLEEGKGHGTDKDLLKKLDTLLDQNKTIAKGLTLIEEKIRHKTIHEEQISEIVEHGMGGRLGPRHIPRA